MLDTNTCIAIIRRRPPKVLRCFSDYCIGEVGISWVTRADLEFGVAESQHVKQNKVALEEFLLALEVASFDREAAVAYGQVHSSVVRSKRDVANWSWGVVCTHSWLCTARCRRPTLSSFLQSEMRARRPIRRVDRRLVALGDAWLSMLVVRHVVQPAAVPDMCRHSGCLCWPKIGTVNEAVVGPCR